MNKHFWIACSGALAMALLAGCPRIPEGVRSTLHDYTFPIDDGDSRYYTRLASDCGKFGGGPGYSITWDAGALHIKTWAVGGATSYAGFWHSLNELARNTGYAMDFNKPLPWPIKDAYQPRITGAVIRVRGSGTWRVELKAKDDAGRNRSGAIFLPAFLFIELRGTLHRFRRCGHAG